MLLGLGVATPLTAQEAQGRCTAPAYDDFDFWVGVWDVETPNGQRAGENRIEEILGNCALQENWVGASGSIGHSFNMYDATRGVWHQTWVDNSGTLLRIEGGVQDGSMVLEGKSVAADGSEVHHRITWSIVEDDGDQVRQHWETSSDAGESWSTAFDGLYRRRH